MEVKQFYEIPSGTCFKKLDNLKFYNWNGDAESQIMFGYAQVQVLQDKSCSA